jgi:hypothetical protein
MSGRVKAAFSSLLFLLIAQPAFPQCSFTTRSSSAFRASMLDLAVDGNDLWAATGYGVQWLDRSVDPPALVASIGLPDTTRVVRASGGFVYAGSGSRIYVLRKNGRAIEVVRSVAAGGTVNDIAIQIALFAATSNGIAHFTLTDPANPVRTNAELATSSPNVTSLSIAVVTLYAADGDSSVEMFTIAVPSQPQRTGALDSLPRSISVNAMSSRVYVSDGQNTDVFANGIRVARTPFGSTSFAAIATDEHFLAGSDLAVHAVDFSVGNNPVELYEQAIPATPGTINRITAMQLAGNRLYVAAGDAGLAVFDTTSFARPYPVRSLAGGSTTSTAINPPVVYATPATGGISEYSASGNVLTFSRTTNTDRQWTMHSRYVSAFVAVSGARVLLPTNNYTTTFPKPILSAATDNLTVWAVLDDNTLRSVATTTDATPQQIPLSFKPSSIVTFEGAGALVELTAEGTTRIHFYRERDFTSAPVTRTVAGAPIGNVVQHRDRIVLATFEGISVINPGSGETFLLPDSNAVLAKQFALPTASTLLELTDRTLRVWDLAARRLTREIVLPADAIAMDANELLAAIATTDGVTTVNYTAAQRLPQFLPIRNANRYSTKAVASDDRLYVFGENGIDIYTTTIGDMPQFVTGLRTAGVIDLAASDEHLFTLAGNSTVTTHGRDGNAIIQATITDGTESRPLSIVSIGGAPWVSLATTCANGICREKKTFILDPLTLAVTATMSGGVVDVVASGTRAYALFDTPSEVRVLSIADPRNPVQTASRALPGPANSIAYSEGAVYVAGTNVQGFDENALGPSQRVITPIATGPVDRIRFVNGCAVLSQRTFAPELHTANGSGTALELPSAVRSVATQNGRIFFLTETSIEVWSAVPATKPSRRRPVK